MADNVDITAGAGTTIKTDQIGTEHIQYVKLMDGTADATGTISGDVTNGLDVDVTRLGRSVAKTSFTAGVIVTGSYSASGDERLCSVTAHFSAAPTTSESFTITMNANAGAAYNTLLNSVNPSLTAMVNYVWFPDGDLYLESGDSIVLAFPNTESVTYGIQIIMEKV